MKAEFDLLKVNELLTNLKLKFDLSLMQTLCECNWRITIRIDRDEEEDPKPAVRQPPPTPSNQE